jgi:hypothetical protein
MHLPILPILNHRCNSRSITQTAALGKLNHNYDRKENDMTEIDWNGTK